MPSVGEDVEELDSPHTLLMGMQSGAIDLKNSLTVT